MQVAAAAASDVTTVLVNSPFREGVEYLYEWQASVHTGPSANAPGGGNPAMTSTRFMGQLVVLSSRDTTNSTNWRVILKVMFYHLMRQQIIMMHTMIERLNEKCGWQLKNVSVAVQQGDATGESEAKWVPAPVDMDNQLTGKPFHLLYSSSQVYYCCY